MPPSAAGLAIGKQVQRDFDNRISNLGRAGELELFRALMRALQTPSQYDFLAREYHGSKYQVRHRVGAPAVHLGLRQCELCDVMILTVPAGRVALPRVTFLQAKYDRRGARPNQGQHLFDGDLVQWSLLRHQPRLVKPKRGVLRFPKDLLSSATLPSIGSFGFFTGNVQKGINFSYAAANALTPFGRCGRTANRLKKREMLRGSFTGYNLRKINSLSELESCAGLALFAGGLHDLVVGSPIAPRSTLSGWAVNTVRQIRDETGAANDPLLAEVFERLEQLAPPTVVPTGGYPTLLLIRTNAEDETT